MASSPEHPAQGPRVYVASLSDYNAGRVLGAWIDAAQTAEALHESVEAMLARSAESPAEEWAIHDFEGFFDLQLDEFELLERVSEIALGIAEHGPAYAAWVRYGEPSDDPHGFEDAFIGQYDSLEAYAEDVLDDLGAQEVLESVPESLRPYVQVDAAGFGRDLELSGDVFTSEAEGGCVYIFTTYG